MLSCIRLRVTFLNSRLDVSMLGRPAIHSIIDKSKCQRSLQVNNPVLYQVKNMLLQGFFFVNCRLYQFCYQQLGKKNGRPMQNSYEYVQNACKSFCPPGKALFDAEFLAHQTVTSSHHLIMDLIYF